jgi:outer membrane protein, heavy metal efflux system
MDREPPSHRHEIGPLSRWLRVWVCALAACCPVLLASCTSPWSAGARDQFAKALGTEKQPATVAQPSPAENTTADRDAAGAMAPMPPGVAPQSESVGQPRRADPAVQKAAATAPVGNAEKPPGTLSNILGESTGPVSNAPQPLSNHAYAPVGNAPGQPLTIEEVLQCVLQNHPMVRVRQHEVEIARGRLITARLLPNPRLVMQSRTPVDAAADSGLTTRIEFTLPIGPKRELRTAAATTAVRESQLAMNIEIKLLLMEATDAAVQVQYLQELVALDRQVAALARQAAEVQRERSKVAAVPFVPFRNVVLAELAATNADLAERNAMTLLEQAQLRLSRAMGLSQPAPPVMQGQVVVEWLQPMSLAAVLDEARRVAPELAQSQAAIEGSRQRLAFARWQAVPDVTVAPVLQESFDHATGQTMGARFVSDLPLFDRNQGVIAESAATVESNRARLAVAEISTLADVSAAYLQLRDVQARWDYYVAHARPLLDKTETTIREAFTEQAVTASEMIDLLEQLARMRRNDLDLRWQHHRLRARLEMLLERRISNPAAEVVPPPSAMPGVSDRPMPAPARR